MSKSLVHTVLALILVCSAFAVAAFGSDVVTEVKIDNFTMSPKTITVAPGTTVRWTNGDDIPHTIVSDERVFKSKVMDTGDQFAYTFAAPGTYNYFCSIHPHMTGTVVVK